jgi:hypothetical protein
MPAHDGTGKFLEQIEDLFGLGLIAKASCQ